LPTDSDALLGRVIADSTNARIIAGVEEEMATQRAIVLAPRRDPSA
jgi:hypothetical protein